MNRSAGCQNHSTALRDFCAVALAVIALSAQGNHALAQTTDISNNMAREHNYSMWYDTTERGSQYDAWGASGNWFGGTHLESTNTWTPNGVSTNWSHYMPDDNVTSGGNDVIYLLNNLSTGGTINVSSLDNQQVGSSTIGHGLYPTENLGAYGPNWSQWAWRTNNTGTITVNSGTTILSAGYGDVVANTAVNVDIVTKDWQFRFDGGSLGKNGDGMLSLRTNTFISGTFTGSNGTLDIRGNTAATATDTWARVDIGSTAVFNAGGTSTVTANTVTDNAIPNGYETSNVAGFTVTSDLAHKMDNYVTIGIADSGNDGTYSTGGGRDHGLTNGVGTLTGQGFNNLARIVVSGSGTLDSITNIGMTTNGVGQDGFGNALTSGILEVSNTLSAGTTAAESVLNIAGVDGSIRSRVTVGQGAGIYNSATAAGAVQHTNIREGGLLEVFGTANLAVDANGHDITTVTDNGSLIEVTGTLVTGLNGWADLYIYNNGGDGSTTYTGAGLARVIGNHIIAQNAGSIGRDIVDGLGSRLEVTGTLTVGEFGHAGGRYTENRYEDRFLHDPGYDSTGEPGTAAKGSQWFDNPDYTTGGLNITPNDDNNVVTGKNTGNDPGLSITRGAVVTSGNGMVAENTNYIGGKGKYKDPVTGVIDPAYLGTNSQGYVVIDNMGAATGAGATQSTWNVVGNSNTTQDSDAILTIGREGDAFVRVLNGGLLYVDGTTKVMSTDANQNSFNDSSGTLHVIGNGGGKVLHETDNDFRSQRFDDGNYVRYEAEKHDDFRSEWISNGATVLGEVDAAAYTNDGIDTVNRQNKRGTIRINNGGYGETKGLYIGLTTAAQGEVSVTGRASELHVLKDESGITRTIEGSGILSVSNEGFVQIHSDANIKLNGIAEISNGAILHLDNEKSLLDSVTNKVSIINARVEGIGTVTGANGVFITQDDTYKQPTSGAYPEIDAFVDPGLAYGWKSRDEDPKYYGILTFGDQLIMTGNVTTNFDINSGYGFDPVADGPAWSPAAPPNTDAYAAKRDQIVVNGVISGSPAPVYASLSGTLNVHARLTDYYEKEVDFLAVHTEGNNNSGTFIAGEITSIYDDLKIMPEQFFEGIGQELRRDVLGNRELWITMKRKDNPFSDAAIKGGGTYNEISTGKGLDSVYMDQIDNKRKDWLPALRYFWYLEGEEFLNAFRNFSGEVRAHTLQMPMQSPWTYAHSRCDYRSCDCPEHLDPCSAEELARTFKSCSSFTSRLKKCTKDLRVWADFIYDDTDVDSDGNAANYQFSRNGIVIGADKPIGKDSYLGVQFAYDQSELGTYRAEAEADDYNFGLYHGTKICENWEWKSYAGMGYQQYNMVRSVESNLVELEWDDTTNPNHPIYRGEVGDLGGRMRSAFKGYSLYANTELARPSYYGKCKQYMVRPYFAIDLTAIWQGDASERGNFTDSHIIALDYLANSYVRLFGRPGVTIERNGKCSTIHGGLSYSFLMGGQQYTSVNNRFQIGGSSFNIRGVDEEGSFLNLNFGGGVFFGKRKQSTVKLDYWGTVGTRTANHAVQLGFQTRF
jgi:T5SS/PEP-CTERM-associated repeat protein